MGALDDAIREHLELKRRHGASDEEIKQAEAEALGPARRTTGSGLGAVPGETALDEAGMPAPVEAFEPPPDPGSAVHDAPPPPPLPDDAHADPAAVPPPGIEPEPLVPSQPLEPVEPVEPEPLHGAVAASEVDVDPAGAEPVQPASPAHGVVEPPPGEPPAAVEPAPAVEPPPVAEAPVEADPVAPPPVAEPSFEP